MPDVSAITAATLSTTGSTPAERRIPKAFAIRIALISIVILVPCFWQRRIQAGDLPSHTYNAWLAWQIDLGNAPSLTIAPVTTNVLFDLILGSLFRSFGANVAERVSVCLCVLVFFWGAFALAGSVIGRRPWFILPSIAMLAYGWVFHMGFFNFYLAMGLCFWAVVFLLKTGSKSRILGLALLAVAYTGHPIPPLCAMAVIIYLWTAERLAPRGRFALFASALLALIVLNYWIRSHFTTEAIPFAVESNYRILQAGALDQLWIFGPKYLVVSVCLAVLWSFLLLRASHIDGFRGLLRRPLFPVCILMAAGIFLLPTRIDAPSSHVPLSFITERMTLAHATLICLFLAGFNPPRWLKWSFVPLTLLYFSFVYADTREINKTEGLMEEMVRPLRVTDRVISSIEAPGSRVQPYAHMVDRVCAAKCLSYSDYEPITRVFRVQAHRENPFVVANLADFKALRDGGYVVSGRDLPMYEITACGPDPCLRQLQAGDVTSHSEFEALPLWWSRHK